MLESMGKVLPDRRLKGASNNNYYTRSVCIEDPHENLYTVLILLFSDKNYFIRILMLKFMKF